MAYCTTDDMLSYRPSICDYEITDWSDQCDEAKVLIDREIKLRWYRDAAQAKSIDIWDVDNEFDPDKLDTSTGQLTRAATFKALALAYEYLSKESEEPDAFERASGYFDNKYAGEMDIVLAEGFRYDWSDDGDPSDEEQFPVVRRLKRG